jgi:hypothetical protein
MKKREKEECNKFIRLSIKAEKIIFRDLPKSPLEALEVLIPTFKTIVQKLPTFIFYYRRKKERERKKEKAFVCTL